jgi:hypothetical protein
MTRLRTVPFTRVLILLVAAGLALGSFHRGSYLSALLMAFISALQITRIVKPSAGLARSPRMVATLSWAAAGFFSFGEIVFLAQAAHEVQRADTSPFVVFGYACILAMGAALAYLFARAGQAWWAMNSTSLVPAPPS